MIATVTARPIGCRGRPDAGFIVAWPPNACLVFSDRLLARRPAASDDSGTGSVLLVGRVAVLTAPHACMQGGPRWRRHGLDTAARSHVGQARHRLGIVTIGRSSRHDLR